MSGFQASLVCIWVEGPVVGRVDRTGSSGAWPAVELQPWSYSRGATRVLKTEILAGGRAGVIIAFGLCKGVFQG